GNYLAGQLKAVILLTPPSTSDPNYGNFTVPALAALLHGSTKNVVILGGTNAVGADVASDLSSKGYTVTRIGGATRYDTANMVDTQPGQTSANTGVKFPDALAAGSLAYKNHFPVILTDGSQSTLSSQASSTISADHISHLLV